MSAVSYVREEALLNLPGLSPMLEGWLTVTCSGMSLELMTSLTPLCSSCLILLKVFPGMFSQRKQKKEEREWKLGSTFSSL